mgnify:CR=1 FL=1
MQPLLRALIVDSEAHARELLQDMLATHRNVRVVGEAHSAPSALSLYDDLHPNLVFMDVKMPKLDGIEVLKRIRKVDSDIAVVIFTGYPNLETAVAAMKLDAVDYLKKPFVKDDSKKVAQVVAERGGKDAKVVRFVRYKVGEGVEKKQTDLAAEVAELAK